MAEPTTWTLVLSVATCLRRITSAGGFRTSTGLTVTTEPEQVPDDRSQDSVLAVVLDSLVKPDSDALRGIGRDVVIAIIAKVSCDLDNPQRSLHDLLDDVDRAMAAGRPDFSVGTVFPQFLDAQAIPAAEGMKWTGAVVRYRAAVRLR